MDIWVFTINKRLKSYPYWYGSQDSWTDIVTRLQDGRPGIGVWYSACPAECSLLHSVHTGSGAQPAWYPTGNWRFSLGKCGWGEKLITCLYLMLRTGIHEAVPSFPHTYPSHGSYIGTGATYPYWHAEPKFITLQTDSLSVTHTQSSSSTSVHSQSELTAICPDLELGELIGSEFISCQYETHHMLRQQRKGSKVQNLITMLINKFQDL